MAIASHEVRKAPELDELRLADQPDGPGAAAMLAAGIGIFTLGLFTLLSEVSESLHEFLESMQMGRGVGPLAGKTILAVVAFFASWILFVFLWRGRDVNIKRVFWIGLILGLLGAVFTFPPVYTAFA